MAFGFLIPALGALAGKVASGRAKGREAEADLAFRRDQQALDRWRAQEGGRLDRYRTQQQSLLEALGLTERGRLSRADLDLARRRFSLDVPQILGRQAAMGDVLSRFKPVSIKHPRANVIDFGSPVSFGPESQQLGRLLAQRALERMQAGEQFEDVPETDFMDGVLRPPEMAQMPGYTPLPRAGKFDKFLNILSGIGGVSGEVQDIMNRVNEYTGRG